MCIKVPEKEYRFEEAVFEAIKPDNFIDMMKEMNPQTKQVCPLSKMNKKKIVPRSHYGEIEVFHRQNVQS